MSQSGRHWELRKLDDAEFASFVVSLRCVKNFSLRWRTKWRLKLTDDLTNLEKSYSLRVKNKKKLLTICKLKMQFLICESCLCNHLNIQGSYFSSSNNWWNGNAITIRVSSNFSLECCSMRNLWTSSMVWLNGDYLQVQC